MSVCALPSTHWMMVKVAAAPASLRSVATMATASPSPPEYRNK